MGETESNKLSVSIVGIKMMDNERILSIAPKPTAIPPRQPITKITRLIMPKRLNSEPLYIPSWLTTLLTTLLMIYVLKFKTNFGALRRVGNDDC